MSNAKLFVLKIQLFSCNLKVQYSIFSIIFPANMQNVNSLYFLLFVNTSVYVKRYITHTTYCVPVVSQSDFIYLRDTLNILLQIDYNR